MSTPNMNLVELVPGVTAGPQYATDIVSNFSTIDSHDHTTGNGVRIPSAGVNINADLGFNGFGANALNRTQYNSLVAALTGAGNYRSVHVVNGELTFLDGSGNAVQITSGGGVAGTPGSIGGLSSPASVSFVDPEFRFFEDTNQYARIACGPIAIRELGAASPNAITLQSPSSLAAGYALTMPDALPASDSIIEINSSGALSYTTPNEIAESVTRTTGTSVGELGVAIAPTVTQTITSGSFVAITGQSLTIISSGRPIVIALVADGTGATSESYISVRHSSTGGDVPALIRVLRDSVAVVDVLCAVSGTIANADISYPPPGILHIDAVSAGTYVYSLEGLVGGSITGRTFVLSDVRMIVYEL